MHVRKHLLMVLVALAVAGAALMAASAQPAAAASSVSFAPAAAQVSFTATDGNCTVSGLAQLCISDQHVSFGTTTVSDKETAVVTGKSSGVLQLRFVMPKGLPKAKQHGCINVIGGVNSFHNAQGVLIKVPWTGKPARICRDKSSPSGWRKVGPKNCGNPFWPPFMRPPRNVFHGKYVVVQNFTFVATIKLKVTLPASVSATASCSVPGASASAAASGSGSASITITGKATSFSRASAVGKATGKATVSETQRGNLMLEASKKASISMTASARAVCTAVVPPGTPIPPPPTPTPTPPSHSCTVGVIVEKDNNGRLVRANVNVDSNNGPNSIISWGDGTATPGLQGSHVYNGDGPWTITAGVTFNDGGRAVCSTSGSTPFVSPPAPPPTAPGPNPPDTTGGAGGTTAPGGGTTGGGTSSCPPGWKPDPASPTTGCVPA
jgi:hypothetical protein